MPNVDDSDNKKIVLSKTTINESNVATEKNQQQIQHKVQDGQQQDHLHKGKNCHSKYTKEKDEKLDLEYLKPEIKAKLFY